MSFNWPVRAEDGPLVDGTWRAVLATYNYSAGYVPNVDVEITAHNALDEDTSAGDAQAVLIYADGLDDEAEVVAAVEGAVERWREVWAGIDLDLSVRYLSDVGLDADLPSPSDARTDLGVIRAMSELKEEGEIAVLIGTTVAGDAWTYGEAGNIPSALVPSEYSAVVLSWAAHAGGDAAFNEDEIRLFGETMGHEVGHYFGLFHPVEDGFRYWDALDDTPACENRPTCEEKLGENLMFPYAICDFSDCLPTWQITDDQAGVFHHYTGNLAP